MMEIMVKTVGKGHGRKERPHAGGGRYAGYDAPRR